VKEGHRVAVHPSPSVRRRRLAAELREIREERGEHGDTVAAALKWSHSKISRYELARTGLKPKDVERLLDYYKITGPRREQLLALAREAAQRGWWEDYSDAASPDLLEIIGLEHEATSIAIWHIEVVPGLLQTDAYARHIIGSYDRIEPVPPGMIERRVRLRMLRQQVLTREPPLELNVVLDESVLRRRIGDHNIMHDQLQRLALDADRPNITLQILPLNAEHAVFGESFVIYHFGSVSDAILHDVVSTEGQRDHIYVEEERYTYLRGLGFQILLDASLDPASSRDLILEAAESYSRAA
jgi:transcriptional regulator with XRE-family HTH domain